MMMELRRAWKIIRSTAVTLAAIMFVLDDLRIHALSRWRSQRPPCAPAVEQSAATVEQAQVREQIA
ncbi:hypothetical protein [Planomonospora sp. ID82291]|uniref:hypothetical protein n=1 Tax=Planomonospora sp. ID82291 TaxID=2738136 RepID=UPI0018C42709|nr:hypothetical protein [Planomonospora sp. ID82291]MBG0819113.1 hypothetical protein [Planomonospora sp. ID82291]